MSGQTAIRAGDFISSIGVNVHLNYTDGHYVDVATVLADLSYLGISLVRTASLNLTHDPLGQAHYAVAADAGIKFDLIVDGNAPLDTTVRLIDEFDAAHPDAIAAIEGPNEVDHWPIQFQGMSGSAAAVAYQNALDAALNADASLADIPLYSFSLGSGATPTGGYDAVALHPYPQHGDQPLTWLQQELNLAPAGAETVITEFGYSTVSAPWVGTDEVTQAKATLNGLFDAAKLGVDKVYLYELLDAYADPSGTDTSKHFGMFGYDNAPKPLATALHNLTTILADDGADDATFAPETADYRLSNLPANSSSLLMEKSSGVFDLVLWSEPLIWDGATNRAVAAAQSAVTVQLGSMAGTVRIYDPLVGTTPIATYTNVQSFTVPLSDHPVIVEFDQDGGSSPGEPAGLVVSGTAGEIVGQLDTLNAMSGLTAITLTDTHVLPVASVAQMSHFITADAQALAAIQGGYSFAITTVNGTGRETVNYDAAGHLTSTVVTTLSHGEVVSETTSYPDGSSDALYYDDGVRTDRIVVHIDRTQDIYHYNTPGERYATEHRQLDAAGNVVLIEGYYAGDILAYSQINQTNGAEQRSYYDLTGTKTTEVLLGMHRSGNAGARAAGDGLSANPATIYLDGSHASSFIENTGVVRALAPRGHVLLSDGASNDTVTNSGTLVGTVGLGGGNDVFTTAAGRVSGVIDAGAGNDRVSGSAFVDSVLGGNDRITGGLGRDVLYGGIGADQFVFLSKADSTVGSAGRDVIMDFRHAQHDRLNLSAMDADARHAGNQAFHFIGTQGFTGHAGELRYVKAGANALVYADLNGDKVADLSIQLYHVPKLVAGDFYL